MTRLEAVTSAAYTVELLNLNNRDVLLTFVPTKDGLRFTISHGKFVRTARLHYADILVSSDDLIMKACKRMIDVTRAQVEARVA